MAKGNMLLGFARKKLGDLVFYRANGEQVARARNRNPKNPKSDRQAVQRMVLASASKTLAALRPLYNHSWQGVEVGNASLRHAQKKLMTLYRAAALAFINGTAEDTAAEFALKGAPIAGFVKGQPMTTGSLSINAYSFAEQNVMHMNLTSAPSEITDDASYRAALATMGLEPGDQLTIVVYSQGSQVVAEFGRASNLADAYRYARITFVPTLPEGFTGTLIDGDYFNAALIERTEGLFPAVNVTTIGGASRLAIEIGGLKPLEMSTIAGAIVRSQKQSNGKTAYSNSDFVDLAFVGNNPWLVFPSYQNGAEDVQLGDEMYLKNAVAAASGNAVAPASPYEVSPSLPLTTVQGQSITITKRNGENWTDGEVESLKFTINGTEISATAGSSVTWVMGSTNVLSVARGTYTDSLSVQMTSGGYTISALS